MHEFITFRSIVFIITYQTEIYEHVFWENHLFDSVISILSSFLYCDNASSDYTIIIIWINHISAATAFSISKNNNNMIVLVTEIIKQMYIINRFMF